MSQNSSKDETPVAIPHKKWWLAIVLPLWLYVSFELAQVILFALLKLLNILHVPLQLLNQTIANTVLSILVYLISLLIVIGVPALIFRWRTSREDLGLSRLPTWTDLIAGPVGLVLYFVLSSVLTFVAVTFFPLFNGSQPQDTGFDGLTQGYEYVLAFVSLVIIAPIAEETLFRGYLFGKLRKLVPVWVAILITSALFGFIHGAWNLGIDTFALSIVLCLLRLKTGSIWASVLLHMLKNGIAFYLLFINPLLLHTLGG